MMAASLSVADFMAIGLYFILIILITFFAIYKANRSTVSGYFLAGRFMYWLPVGASIFASNIGSEHFIGLAGSGAAAGLSVGAFELNACILIQLLGWVFLPVYIASQVCTLPEYMSKRFGGHRIRLYLAFLSVMLYILTKISVNLYSGSIFIQQGLGWSTYPSVFIILAVTAFTTITGGLTAVMYTDTLQAMLMMGGGVGIMVISLVKVGGMSGLHAAYFDAVSEATASSNSTCGLPNPKAFIMLRSMDDPDLPWLGFLLGQTTASIWYWCADQMMVQRALASKSLSHAQGGTLLAGFMKLTPAFMIVIPGMIARVLFPNEVACSTEEECLAACENPVSCTNIAYPKLVMELAPSGFRGVMFAVMLSALMSDLTSIFNSASTLFTVDIYTKFRKNAKTVELMVVGRPWLFKHFHYMYIALFLFCTTLLVLILVSYLTEPPSPIMLHRTTYWTRKSLALENVSSDDAVPMQEIHESLKETRDTQDTLPNVMTTKSVIKWILLKFLCGIEENVQDQTSVQQRFQQISSLKQTPMERCVLNGVLTFLTLLTVFLFVLFTFGSPYIFPSPNI